MNSLSPLPSVRGQRILYSTASVWPPCLIHLCCPSKQLTAQIPSRPWTNLSHPCSSAIRAVDCSNGQCRWVRQRGWTKAVVQKIHCTVTCEGVCDGYGIILDSGIFRNSVNCQLLLLFPDLNIVFITLLKANSETKNNNNNNLTFVILTLLKFLSLWLVEFCAINLFWSHVVIVEHID